jgi:AraC-like DNA-binding protein
MQVFMDTDTMVGNFRGNVLVKIATELNQALADRQASGTPASLRTRLLSSGQGWTVEDVICTSGPRDRVFEERHARYMVALVVAGTFECRAESGHELMTPGSLLLGNAGQCFECGHQHSAGDRCIAFGYTPELLDELAIAAGRSCFRHLRIPGLAETAALVAAASTALMSADDCEWEELSFRLLDTAWSMTGNTRSESLSPSAFARVSRAIRRIDSNPSDALRLDDLAAEAKLSAYHFLRVFERLIGLTPHQYVRRARLRNAAARLSTSNAKVVEIALDCGFGDVTNFNRAFRAEFGMTPLAYRRQSA